jgi:putative transposase
MEVRALLERYAGVVDEPGRAAVVRNGHHPAREILTGIGAVLVQVSKVRSRTQERVVFRSSLVPPYVRRTKEPGCGTALAYLKGGPMLVGAGRQRAIARGSQPAQAPVASGVRAVGQEAFGAGSLGVLVGRWHLRADDQELCALVIIGVNERGERRAWLLGRTGRDLPHDTTAALLGAQDRQRAE